MDWITQSAVEGNEAMKASKANRLERRKRRDANAAILTFEQARAIPAASGMRTLASELKPRTSGKGYDRSERAKPKHARIASKCISRMPDGSIRVLNANGTPSKRHQTLTQTDVRALQRQALLKKAGIIGNVE